MQMAMSRLVLVQLPPITSTNMRGLEKIHGKVDLECKFGACVVVQWVKLPLATPACHENNGPGCSIS